MLTVYPAESWAPRVRAHELSIRHSVCPSVCDVEVSLSHRLEFCENNFTAISLTFSLSAYPKQDGSTPKETTPNFRSGVGKIVDFRHLSRHISETVQDRVQVAIDH